MQRLLLGALGSVGRARPPVIMPKDVNTIGRPQLCTLTAKTLFPPRIRAKRSTSMASSSSDSAALTATAGDSVWELYYWSRMETDGKNHMIGRGEFVRLMFEAAGQAYVDVGVIHGSARVREFVYDGGNTSVPVFAPPAIRKGSFVLYQTPSIMRFLGKQFGMFPDTEEQAAHADALMSFLTDFIAEGRLVFHPVCFTMSYYQQVEEAKPHVEWFQRERMPRFLTHLNHVLQHNQSLHPGSSVFVGGSLT